MSSSSTLSHWPNVGEPDSHVDDDVEHGAGDARDVLRLAGRHVGEVDAADHAGGGHRAVRLGELEVTSDGLAERRRLEPLEEHAARVAVLDGRDLVGAVDRQRADLHSGRVYHRDRRPEILHSLVRLCHLGRAGSPPDPARPKEPPCRTFLRHLRPEPRRPRRPPGDDQPATAAAYDPAPSQPVATPTETIAAAGPSNLKIFGAEAVGTGVLMIVGPGTAILASEHDRQTARRRPRVRVRAPGDGLHHRPRLGLPHQPGRHLGVLPQPQGHDHPGLLLLGGPVPRRADRRVDPVHRLGRWRSRQHRHLRRQRLGGRHRQPVRVRLDGRRRDLLHRPADLRRPVDDDEGLPGRLRRSRRRASRSA